MLNKTILQGRFTRDPEIEVKGGFDMCEFTIAWSEKFKEKETKCFLRCKAWREQANHVVKYFKKGQECVVEGKIATEEWEKDGQKQSRTVLNLERIYFVGSKAQNPSNNNSGAGDDGFMNIPADADEELPFNE